MNLQHQKRGFGMEEALRKQWRMKALPCFLYPSVTTVLSYTYDVYVLFLNRKW